MAMEGPSTAFCVPDLLNNSILTCYNRAMSDDATLTLLQMPEEPQHYTAHCYHDTSADARGCSAVTGKVCLPGLT